MHSHQPDPQTGRHVRHEDHCDSALCCRCQTRPWNTRVGPERLCDLCAKCCRECGRRPAPHVDGLPDGLCGPCRGRCQRCNHPLTPEEGAAHTPECAACSVPLARPGRDPVTFVLRRTPRSLMDAMHGQVPAAVYQSVKTELARRTPQQLADRIDRRWYGRWTHALNQVDEDHRLRWSPDQIALQLVLPAPCPVNECEDGTIINTDQVCSRCRQPEHRFVADNGTPSSEQTRTAALASMRETVRSSPYRTGNGRRTTKSQRLTSDAMDQALHHVRQRLADPTKPRLTEPPLQPEPGTDDSVILAARAARHTADQDPIRRAALARARIDKTRRPRPGD
ncbi:hypothetical protein OG422_31485 (plasmid) [Streptomyces sp. NBC_01525]|uniref:hypothetical protein n=1 Tax=Streptomyces sp. NBC_01525 TaxID=2903893 RepID=UPI0038659552